MLNYCFLGTGQELNVYEKRCVLDTGEGSGLATKYQLQEEFPLGSGAASKNSLADLLSYKTQVQPRLEAEGLELAFG